MKLLNLDSINGTFASCAEYTGREVMELLRQQETIDYSDGGIEGQELEAAISHFVMCYRCIFDNTALIANPAEE